MSKQTSMITNFYQHLPSQFKEGNGIKYKNYDKLKISVPFRMLIVGSSGSGKTNVAMNLISLMSCFTQIFLFVKCLDEPLYNFLIQKMTKLGIKLGRDIIFYSTDVDEMPSIDTIDKSESTLFIFDDMISESVMKQKHIAELFIRGRKANCSSIFITQSYFSTNSLIRKNCDYIILKRINTARDLRAIIKEYNLSDMTPEKLLELYKKVTQKGLTSFLLIDLNTNDEKLKFRENFSPIQ